MKIEGHGGVQYWLNRVAEEKISFVNALIKKAQTMNYQAVNFKKMPVHVQEKVLEELKQAMSEMGWKDSLDDYQKELSIGNTEKIEW